LARNKPPVTPAVRFLKAAGVLFTPHEYRYQDKGGTAVAASELAVDEHQVIKTLVFEDEHRRPFLVLMHGDRQVSTKNLARQLNTKTVTPCDPVRAEKHTGYKVGGISPFGTIKKLPVYLEQTVLDLPRVIINGGRRGLLFDISSQDLVRVLAATPIHAALER